MGASNKATANKRMLIHVSLLVKDQTISATMIM
jgi:hypothetical protein